MGSRFGVFMGANPFFALNRAAWCYIRLPLSNDGSMCDDMTDADNELAF